MENFTIKVEGTIELQDEFLKQKNLSQKIHEVSFTIYETFNNYKNYSIKLRTFNMYAYICAVDKIIDDFIQKYNVEDITYDVEILDEKNVKQTQTIGGINFDNLIFTINDKKYTAEQLRDEITFETITVNMNGVTIAESKIEHDLIYNIKEEYERIEASEHQLVVYRFCETYINYINNLYGV